MKKLIATAFLSALFASFSATAAEVNFTQGAPSFHSFFNSFNVDNTFFIQKVGGTGDNPQRIDQLNDDIVYDLVPGPIYQAYQKYNIPGYGLVTLVVAKFTVDGTGKPTFLSVSP